MSAPTIAVEVSLAVAVLVAWICCLGLWLMEDFFDKLHFMAPVTTVSMFFVLLAVVIETGWGQATVKTILVLVIMLLINAVLTHATARAGRIEEHGQWQPCSGEKVSGDEKIPALQNPPREKSA